MRLADLPASELRATNPNSIINIADGGLRSRRSALQVIGLALAIPRAAAAAEVSGAQVLTLGRVAVGEKFYVLGLVAEPLVNEAGRRTGIEFRYRALPPLRSLDASNSGEIDGEVIRLENVSLSYPNLVEVPTPIVRTVLSVYAAGPGIATRTRADIQRMRLGIVRGHLQSLQTTQGVTTIEANLPSALFELLANGRCDAVLIDHVQGAVELRDHPVPGIQHWPYAWARAPMHMLLNRKHAALVPRLDAALRQMAGEGLLERGYADGLRTLRIDAPPPDEPLQPR